MIDIKNFDEFEIFKKAHTIMIGETFLGNIESNWGTSYDGLFIRAGSHIVYLKNREGTILDIDDNLIVHNFQPVDIEIILKKK